jgi:signal peptidase I
MASDKSTPTPESRTGRITSKQGPAARSSEPAETKSLAVTVKETLESIVVAFILAFVFRAFIVEAFVIPTGSMAVTLYGRQLTKTCSTCGFEYALGEPPPENRERERRLCCPNCRMARDQFTPSELKRADSGDRILVHKWPLDLPGRWLGAKRWEVTVFKDPEDGRTNFIKRLVGLPGEVLEIIDGDVYAARIEDLSPEVLDQFDQLRKLNHRYGSGGREMGSSEMREEIRKLYAEVNKKVLPHLKIQRKIEQTPLAQQSLWFNVYNHDFLPNYELRSDQMKPPVGWSPDTPDAANAWKDTSQRTIKFESVSDETLYLRFEGVIDDFYAYNNDDAGEGPNARGGFSSFRRLVGDLRLSLSWMIRAGSGDLVLEMNRDTDKFIATIGTSGKVKLEVEHLLGESAVRRESVPESSTTDAFARDRAVRVEFINVDYQVLLLIDGKLVARTNDKQYHPSLEKLERFCRSTPPDAIYSAGPQVEPSTVRIGGRNMQCELRHLALERDVYYRSQPLYPHQSNLQDWLGWGTAGRPILLRRERSKEGKCYAAEYFMLGDNSPQSKDSRLWAETGEHLLPLGDEYQRGTVPEDQLIGKAFFVYWPAGYRAAWTGGIGLIPNFGRMRWIR